MLDTKFQQGIEALNTWYYTEIRACAQTAINALIDQISTPEGKNTTGIWLQDYVDQRTAKHEFVIFTHKAKAALLVSSHEDEYEGETGQKPPTPEVACCFAMRADIWEILNERLEEWKPKMNKFTIATGRTILRDGNYFCDLRRDDCCGKPALTPVQADALVRWLVCRLNEPDFDLEAITRAHLETP